MNKRKDIVPNNLREYRLKAGLTQKQVANMLGFASEERISHWENGNNVPSLINLFKLSNIYRATPFHLYEEVLNKTQDELAIVREKDMKDD